MTRLVKWGKETDPKCACGCIVETTAHVMLQCPILHDAITAGHDTVLANVRDALRVLDGTFVQLCCAPSGTLFPELMEELPGLTECPSLESWKQPFY